MSSAPIAVPQTSQSSAPQRIPTSPSSPSSPTLASNRLLQATNLSPPTTLNGAQSSSPARSGHPSPIQRPWDVSRRKLSLTTPWNWFVPYIYLTIASIVYGVTLYVAASASALHGFLGVASPSFGTWILTILSKANDIALSFAVTDAFDSIAWGELRDSYRGGVRNVFIGLELSTFLALRLLLLLDTRS